MSALTDLFSNIADAIRAKNGSTEQIQASQFPTAIAGLSGAPVYVDIRGTGDATLTLPENARKNNIVFYSYTSAISFTSDEASVALCGAYTTGDQNYGWMRATSGGEARYTGNTSLTYDKTTGIVTVNERWYPTFHYRFYAWD